MENVNVATDKTVTGRSVAHLQSQTNTQQTHTLATLTLLTLAEQHEGTHTH